MQKLLYRIGNVFGVLSWVLFTFLLFHMVGTESPSPSGDVLESSFNGRHNVYSATTVKLFGNATQIEGYSTNFFNPTFPEFKTSWAGYRSRIKVTEELFKTGYRQYNNLSKHLLVNYRKSDLIFPFHYYW
ncbi:hypothetical protein K8352_01550 [Flavobacteriaceae bacterium F89]|uniref:Uncharacterized protein n=1 Tax=Cerina litoralis TaxID=2874477 RepID=A0AAE3ETR0_9FLAO|nr:hypothetical protein [Cerina litoralis]MCG2459427.1 hypothetical protein [Cerina litoralis]